MKRETSTTKVELVETQNLALSLKRLTGPPYEGDRWRRALYHALTMTHTVNRDEAAKIREALELP
jgi:hypothetical protein